MSTWEASKFSPSTPIQDLPDLFTTKNTGLSRRELDVLVTKSKWLRENRARIARSLQGQKKSTNTRSRSRNKGTRSTSRSQTTVPSSSSPPVSREQLAFEATLIFAQEEGGTAVCVSETGLILTCAHCIAESRQELDAKRGGVRNRVKWLLFSDGRAVKAECFRWDSGLDLAALRILGVQKKLRDVAQGEVQLAGTRPSTNGTGSLATGRIVIDLTGSDDDENLALPTATSSNTTTLSTENDLLSTRLAHASLSPLSGLHSFSYIQLASTPPVLDSPLICIGQPGPIDLETTVADTPTDFDILHVSKGRFRGCAGGQDIYDNSEIGALCHDCWTYWGHSGSPLVMTGLAADTVDESRSGSDEKSYQRKMLVGLHSSWDDETGMRRGVAWEAIQRFLDSLQ